MCARPKCHTPYEAELGTSKSCYTQAVGNVSKRLLLVFIIAAWCRSLHAAEASQLEVPAISIEQAILVAQRHISSERIDISDSYISKAEWNPRFGLISFWRIEWRNEKYTRGGDISVTIYADGKVEHVLGK